METKEAYHRTPKGKIYKVALIPIDAHHAVRNHPHQWSFDGKFADKPPARAESESVVGIGGGVLQGGLGVLGEVDPKALARASADDDGSAG